VEEGPPVGAIKEGSGSLDVPGQKMATGEVYPNTCVTGRNSVVLPSFLAAKAMKPGGYAVKRG
jgi:hypothetical protein